MTMSKPKHVEMVTGQDWEQATAWHQDTVENKDLEELMANIYLDAQEDDSVCGSGGDGQDVMQH
jgi:hypothetical protein